MNRWGLLAVALTIIAFASAITLVLIPAPKTPLDMATTTPPAGIPDLITVASPKPEDGISSTTLTVTGTARGTWYFEAVFPIELHDAQGAVIAQGQGQAQTDWMTENFVPFSATLSYPAQPKGSHGTLVVKNDNPSGDPAKEKSVFIPVVFQ